MTEPDADDTEAAWREIVENYGDRALVEPDPPADPGEPGAEPHAESHAEPMVFRIAPRAPEPPERSEDPWDEDGFYDDEFVPPTPPALPRPRPDRLLAWLGLLGTPVIVLIVLIARIRLEPIFVWLLVAAFVGGFGYLLATMSQEPRDPWDDGSRL